jgi:Breast carcinoma amplified sequence 2 (BCAS2)
MANVHAMIAAEMRTFQPKNYLKDFPAPQLKFLNSKILQNELSRVSNGKSMETLDMSR